MMTGITKKIAIVVVSLAGIALATIVGLHLRKNPRISNRDLVTVHFGMLPYGDHTYAIIGAKQGWFSEVGIDFDYQSVKIENVVPFIENKSLDVASVPPGVIMAAYESNPHVVNFVFGDVFQGFAIMAQPNRGYKSVTDFMGGGMPIDQALRAAVQQLRGKTFAYPSEAAIKPFIDLALEKGDLSRTNFTSLVLDDPLTVNAMRNHQADFQVGGAPSHIVLGREGFVPILTSSDLAKAAKPSPDSSELSSIFTDGWACDRQYFNDHRDTVLRLASVNFRITQFIHDHPQEALAIHMPYLSQITGQSFTSAEGGVIYESLDPFYTFEEQKPWYHDSGSVYYYKNINGANINSYVKQGIYKRAAPSVDDVSVAYDVYTALESLKQQSDALFQQIGDISNKSGAVKDMVARAHSYYDKFDFLDSQSTAQSALALINQGK